MNTLQKAFEEALVDSPYLLAAEMISQKLAAKGVVLSTRERQRLIEQVRTEAGDVSCLRRWPWWGRRNVIIEITEAEAERVHAHYDEFLNNRLPDLIMSTANDLSVCILSTLHRGWRSELHRENRERRGFEKRLRKRWGKAIELLRMSLVISREFGGMVSATTRDSRAFNSPCLLDILTRLHARACQVADEVVCLLDRGFADGAMARWRTLHEIATVAFFLNEHGESLAKRYFDHQVVESYRAALDYRRCSGRLGYEPMAESEFDEIRRAYELALQKYGKPFGTQHGWAADLLGLKRPSIRDIERAAGIDHLRPYYSMASHNVHANPKGVFFKLGLIGEVDLLLAGPSNAGLADPGHSTAISLLHVSVALGLIEPTLDSLVGLGVLSRLVDEIGEAFQEANLQLEADIG